MTLQRMLWMAAALASGLSSIEPRAAAGDADPTFGGSGYVRYSAPKTVPGLFAAGLALDDGSIVVAGGADTDIFVRRYRVDGSLDTGFGTAGTTVVPELVGDGRTVPEAVHLFRDPQGGYLIEQFGIVRKLSTAGAVDPSYRPAKFDVHGQAYSSYNLLPQPDGRFVVVTDRRSSTAQDPISLRFYLADGTADSARGDASGERLLYPGEGQRSSVPLSAINDDQGRILIAARWDRYDLNYSLVLIRLNSDGSYDKTFGQGGVAVIASNMGRVSTPKVSVGRDGRIGYAFGLAYDPVADPSFLVYLLTPSGQQDTTAPSGGRISVVVPRAAGLDGDTLQWLSPSPSLAIGAHSPGSSNPSPQPPAMMLWQADIATGKVGTAMLSSKGLGTDFRLRGMGAVASSPRLWAFGVEDQFVYGEVARAALVGYGRGVLLPVDFAGFGTVTPTRVVTTFGGQNHEAFTALQPLPDGRLMLLGTSLLQREQYPAPTLSLFSADGRLDPSFGKGTGRVAFGSGDGARYSIVPSNSNKPTILKSLITCGFAACFYRASLWRFTPAGEPDTGFGQNGTLDLTFSSGAAYGTQVATGFADDQGRLTLLRMSPPFGADSFIIRPERWFPVAGDPPFQATPAQLSGIPLQSLMKLDEMPDGRLQAILVGGVGLKLTVQVFRWLKNGALDPSSIPAIQPPALDSQYYAYAIDTAMLPDGRTLLALDHDSVRMVMRLRADGSLDPTFGDGGAIRIAAEYSVGMRGAQISLAGDGKFLLAYSTPLGSKILTALVVARFTADGQPDRTFTADGRFDSVFSLGAAESAGDVAVLPDGHIVAVGASGQRGLLLRLRGTAVETSPTSVPVVEYFNTVLGHYFVTIGQGEIVGVDKGQAGYGWQRTALGFRAYAPETGIPPDAEPVCRFYGTPGRGPNSHFYTVRASECAAVKLDPGWTYEGIVFHAYAPLNGQCSTGQQPVYRVYNNRFAQNDSNHRYMTDQALYAQMQTQGWLPEGVVLCGAGR